MLDTINIAICEDEKIQVDLLEEYVRRWAQKNKGRRRFTKYYFHYSYSPLYRRRI